MKTKYIDTVSTCQLIGCILSNTFLLDNEKYHFSEEDFPEDFHRIVFGSIYNLFIQGANEITTSAIEDYLISRPDKFAIYKANKGDEWIEDVVDGCSIEAFDFYYNRVKKMTLFRAYENVGMNLDWLYNPFSADMKKKNEQEDFIDNSTINQLADLINDRIDNIKLKYADGTVNDAYEAGSDIFGLIERFKAEPDIGYPLYGAFINTCHRGARFKKFFLRSATTGLGKTRSMIADACCVGCAAYYDDYKNEWHTCGAPQPALYITTEQELEEIQSMMLSFVSAVEEEKIRTGDYTESEKDRLMRAAQIIQDGKVIIKILPDFSLQDIENTIKYGIREYNIRYVFHDYIHTSVKILNEIGSRSGVKNLREDNILFLLSVKLKDICNQYDVFIESATQLNGDYRNTKVFDQNLLRGAKSIADKIDFGSIMLPPTQEDIEKIKPILVEGAFPTPEIKMSIYKNRGGRWKDILLWCKARRGICRIEPMFATDLNLELIELPDLRIEVED